MGAYHCIHPLAAKDRGIGCGFDLESGRTGRADENHPERWCLIGKIAAKLVHGTDSPGASDRICVPPGCVDRHAGGNLGKHRCAGTATPQRHIDNAADQQVTDSFDESVSNRRWSGRGSVEQRRNKAVIDVPADQHGLARQARCGPFEQCAFRFADRDDLRSTCEASAAFAIPFGDEQRDADC